MAVVVPVVAGVVIKVAEGSVPVAVIREAVNVPVAAVIQAAECVHHQITGLRLVVVIRAIIVRL